METTLIQILTNDFYTSREALAFFIKTEDVKECRERIRGALKLYNSSASGNLMGDYKLNGRDNYTILETNIGATSQAIIIQSVDVVINIINKNKS